MSAWGSGGRVMMGCCWGGLKTAKIMVADNLHSGHVTTTTTFDCYHSIVPNHITTINNHYHQHPEQ